MSFSIPPEDKLDTQEAELMDYQLSDDLPPHERGLTRLGKWWANVGAPTTVDCEARLANLFALTQCSCLLILPHSTSQVEGVFSLVRRIKTGFRASLENSQCVHFWLAS